MPASSHNPTLSERPSANAASGKAGRWLEQVLAVIAFWMIPPLIIMIPALWSFALRAEDPHVPDSWKFALAGPFATGLSEYLSLVTSIVIMAALGIFLAPFGYFRTNLISYRKDETAALFASIFWHGCGWLTYLLHVVEAVTD